MFVVLNTAYSSGGSGGGVSVYLYSVMELFCLLTLELLAVHHTRPTHLSLSLSILCIFKINNLRPRYQSPECSSQHQGSVTNTQIMSAYCPGQFYQK